MVAIRRERLTGRNGAIWQAYLRGKTLEAIAAEFSISNQRVSQILAEVRASIPEPVIEDIRKRESERIERLYAKAWEVIEAEHPLVSVQKGTIIVDPDTGERLHDDGPVLQGIATALRIHERVAKAYGTDAPDRLDATITGDSAANVAWLEMVEAQRAQRAAAREHDGSPDGGGTAPEDG